MSYPYKLEPRSYQRAALKSVYRRKRFFLAFDMGTGKTKIALDFIGSMLYHKKVGQALVIAPLSVLSTVWEDEIAKNWNDSLGICYALLRPGCSSLWETANLVLTNYDYARTMVKELMAWAPDIIVLDESHKIKNPHARQSRMAHKLGNVCEYAICLTGTPIGNRPLDLWSQFKFLVPGLLEEKYKDFKDHYSIWGGGGGFELRKYKNLKELAHHIHPYVRSLKKKDYLDLPDKNFIEIPVEMGEKARKMYKDMERDFIAYVTDTTGNLGTKAGPFTISAPIALAKLTKLSQISGGYIRSTEEEKDFPVHRAKLEVLEGITDDLLESDVKRVVVYARFLWEIKEIRKVLAPSWTTYQISGEIPDQQRKMAQSMFNESGGAMICQIASGSLGMNLQTANYTIFFSLDYSHINFLQAQDRTHRMGQKLPCFYYLLLCKGTLDRKIYRVLREKKDVADEIINLVKEAQLR